MIDFVYFSNFQSLKLLQQFAGKDLSHYFEKNGLPKIRINQHGVSVPVFPPVTEKALEDDRKLSINFA